jgi:outer membrane protein TolC
MALRTALFACAIASSVGAATIAAEPGADLADNPSLAYPLNADFDQSIAMQEAELPTGFEPWWQSRLASPLASEGRPVGVTVGSLVTGALEYSSQIRAFSDLPMIRAQTIGEEEGLFDWRVFADTAYRRISDPVGNFLTTGGSPRFRERDWQVSGGFRRRNLLGGEFEIAQEFGFTDNNSDFFIPNDQGTSRLRLSYIQPLKRGAGVNYNSAQIYLAMMDAAAANDEYSRQLQSHILEVSRAYWAMYVERATLLQRVKLTQESRQIFDLLNQRRGLDVDQAQLLRAKSALAQCQSSLARSVTAVRNAESRVIRLVNDPSLEPDTLLELLPELAPEVELVNVQMNQAKLSALRLRPEIAQAHKQIAAGAKRQQIACNELQPVLNAVVETYIAGLNGDYDIGQSFADQFSQGEPGYTVGLVYEYPIHNRTARSRYRRRRLELRQLQNQLQATIETLMLEVEVAVREVQTSHDELRGKYVAMTANQAEVKAIDERWKVFAGDNPNATLFLDNLLDAQVRLATSEHQLAEALATYNLSLISLARAQGTLLQDLQIDTFTHCHNGLPTRTASVLDDIVYSDELMPVDSPFDATGPIVDLPVEQSE